MDNVIPALNDIIQYLQIKSNNLLNPPSVEQKIQDLIDFRDNDLTNHIQTINNEFEDYLEDFNSQMLNSMSSIKTSVFGIVAGELGIRKMKENIYNNTALEFRNYTLSTNCDPTFNGTEQDLIYYANQVFSLFSNIKDSSNDMLSDILKETVRTIQSKIIGFSSKISIFQSLSKIKNIVSDNTIECLVELATVNSNIGNIMNEIMNNATSNSEIIKNYKDDITNYKESRKDDILYSYIGNYKNAIENIFSDVINNSPTCADSSGLQTILQTIEDIINKLEKCFKRLPSTT